MKYTTKFINLHSSTKETQLSTVRFFWDWVYNIRYTIEQCAIEHIQVKHIPNICCSILTKSPDLNFQSKAAKISSGMSYSLMAASNLDHHILTNPFMKGKKKTGVWSHQVSEIDKDSTAGWKRFAHSFCLIQTLSPRALNFQPKAATIRCGVPYSLMGLHAIWTTT